VSETVLALNYNSSASSTTCSWVWQSGCVRKLLRACHPDKLTCTLYNHWPFTSSWDVQLESFSECVTLKLHICPLILYQFS